MASPGTGPTNHVLDVRVALPADWWVIPLLDPAEREHAETGLLNRQLAGRADADQLRPELAKALAAQTGAAKAAGARLLALSLQQAEGLPIPASLVVHWSDERASDDADLLADLEDTLRPAAGTEPPEYSLDRAKLPSGLTLRQVRVEAASASTPKSLVADYWVQRPDGGLVHLAFATPLLPLRDALVELFDAVAGSLRWVT